MRKIGNTYLAIVIALLALWLVPRLYRIITIESYSSPFTLYSPIVHDFTALADKSGKDFKFEDTEGKVYGDSVQPLFYSRVLASKGALPDTIEGRAVTLEEIEFNNVIFSSDPKDINRDAPNVYMLLESVPQRLDLEKPEYALISRKSGISLVKMNENKVDQDLTDAFSKALSEKGFKAPIEAIDGNPNPKKEYDEGYLLTDANGDLFHLKMASGQPWVEKIEKTPDLKIKNLFITENENKATLGFIVDQENKFYVLDSLKKIIPTDVVADPSKDDILLVGDIFYYTVKVSDDEGENFWALRNGSFETVKTYRREYPESTKFDLPKYIFPFQMSLTSSLDRKIQPRLHDFSWIGLVVDLILIGLYFGIKAYRKKK